MRQVAVSCADLVRRFIRKQENLGLPRRDILVRIDYEKCGTLVRECSKNQIFLATFAERVAQFQCQLFFDDEGTPFVTASKSMV